MNCVLSSLPILRLPGFLYKVFFLPYSFNLLLFNYSSMIYHPLDKVLRFYILESDVLFIFGCASHLFKHPLSRYLTSQVRHFTLFFSFSGRMSWLATTENTLVPSLSNAKFVREVSPGQTTWRSTWRDTCQNIWKTDTTSTVFLSLVTSQTSLKWTHYS